MRILIILCTYGIQLAPIFPFKKGDKPGRGYKSRANSAFLQLNLESWSDQIIEKDISIDFVIADTRCSEVFRSYFIPFVQKLKHPNIKFNYLYSNQAITRNCAFNKCINMFPRQYDLYMISTHDIMLDSINGFQKILNKTLEQPEWGQMFVNVDLDGYPIDEPRFNQKDVYRFLPPACNGPPGDFCVMHLALINPQLLSKYDNRIIDVFKNCGYESYAIYYTLAAHFAHYFYVPIELTHFHVAIRGTSDKHELFEPFSVERIVHEGLDVGLGGYAFTKHKSNKTGKHYWTGPYLNHRPEFWNGYNYTHGDKLLDHIKNTMFIPNDYYDTIEFSRIV